MKTTRIIPTIAAALVLAGAVSEVTVPLARATKGSCDPAPDPYNIQSQTKANGEISIEIRYGWDGVSVFPNCAGPILRVRVTNTGVQTWYAHLEGRKGKPVTIAIPPGTARNYSGTQLAQVGLVTLDDITDLTLTLTP